MRRKFKHHRRKNQKIIFFVIIIALIGFVWTYNSGYINIPDLPEREKLTSIEDLHQHSGDYVDENVSIKGKLNKRGGGYSLEDDNGYWVWVGNNAIGEGCIERQRDYNFNSQTYTARGVWMPSKSCGFGGICFGYGEGHNYLNCFIPID